MKVILKVSLLFLMVSNLIASVPGSLIKITGSPFSAGTGPRSVAYKPDGLFLAVANRNSSNVSIFAVNQTIGVLTEITGSPFSAGTGPRGVAYSPNGIFLAVANRNADNVSVFSFEQLPTDAFSRAIYLKYEGFCSLLN